MQIPPVGFPVSFRAKLDKTISQGAHRLCVLAYGVPAAVQRLLWEDDTHASHLCHCSLCIEPTHIVVESRAANEARKTCKGLLVVRTTIGGVEYDLSPAPCPHNPPCIFDFEVRDAVQV